MGTIAAKAPVIRTPFAGATATGETQRPADRLPSQNVKLFGYRLQALRKARRLTQAALAEKMETDPDYVSRAENGLSLPPTDHQFKMAKGLGMTFQEFFAATWGDIYNAPPQ